MPTQIQLPALTFSYTGPDLATHSAACGYFACLTEDTADLAAGIQFYLYDSQVAATDALQSKLTGGVDPVPVAQHTYPLTAAQFLSFAAQPGQAGVSLEQEEFQDMYGVAQSTLDVEVKDAAGNPVMHSTGKPQMTSFVAGAQVVMLTLTVPGS